MQIIIKQLDNKLVGRIEALVPRSASKFPCLFGVVSSTSRDLVIHKKDLQGGFFSSLFILLKLELSFKYYLLCPHMRAANSLYV